VNRRGNDSNNKLLYDPNQREQRRLGAFSMLENEEITEEEPTDTEQENSNPENNLMDENVNENANGSKSSLIGTGAKKVAGKAGAAAANVAKKVVSKFMMFIIANPWILGIIAFLIIFILILFAAAGGTSDKKYIGLGGYDYLDLGEICENITVYDTTSGQDGTYSLEEYVEGVVAAEVGMFDDYASFEVFAIAARTYALNRLRGSSDCTIAGNATAQAFRVNTNEKIKEAVRNTRGLVLTRDGSMFSAMYDAFCWDTKDEDYYYMCQGDYDNDEPLKIPVDWVLENIPKLSGQPFVDNPRYSSHGQGMSQDGVYYLSTVLSMEFEDILKYFYGSDIELMSIYRSFGYNGEYALNPDAESYKGLKYLNNQSFEELLSNNSMSIDEYNNYLAEIVETSGVGTRDAVINVAVSLIGSIAQMGYRLPYNWGGKYYAQGANAYWGTVKDMSAICSYYDQQYSNGSACRNYYKYSSFDCSGFVNWAIMNGMRYNYTESVANDAHIVIVDGNRVIYTDELDPNNAVCAPGDVLVKNGHIVLVVGLDDDNKRYIVAESRGDGTNSGDGGVRLSYYKYNQSGYYCRRLDNIYDNYKGNSEE